MKYPRGRMWAELMQFALDGRRAAAIEPVVRLGEAVLQEDPDQYPQLVADAEKLTSKLDLAPEERDALFRSIRRRYADVAGGNEVVGAKTKG